MAGKNRLRSLLLTLPCALASSLFAAGADDQAVLQKCAALVGQQQASTVSFKQSLESQTQDPQAQSLRFLLRIERQLFQLSEAVDASLRVLNKPVYQSYKTKVCAEGSNLIATSRAMVRVIKEDSSLSLDTSTFDLFVAELTQVRKDLECQ